MNAPIIPPRERPILMSGSLVVATLERRKTQTRRVAKLNAAGRIQERGGKRRQWHPDDPAAVAGCPYGAPGDRLWVRETWRPRVIHSHADNACDCGDVAVTYPADGADHHFSDAQMCRDAWGWTMPKQAYRGNVPGIHMPRWASRLLLAVTRVQLQPLKAITEDDARAEGCSGTDPEPRDEGGTIFHWQGVSSAPSPLAHFAHLWDRINAHRPGCAWHDNPRVWVVSFEVVEAKGWRAA